MRPVPVGNQIRLRFFFSGIGYRDVLQINGMRIAVVHVQSKEFMPESHSIFFSAFFLSLDSFVVALALSPLIPSRAQRWRLAALFGVGDGVAALIGSGLGWSSLGAAFAARAVPLFVLTHGVYCLVAAGWNRFRADPRLAFALPVLMSLDNLVYGFGAPAGDLAAPAVVLGLVSFSFAAAGLWLGGVLRAARLRRADCTAGFALIAAGFVLLFT